MKTLHFSTKINAPAEIVWKTMLDDATYREWAGVFGAGSHFTGSWLPGTEIIFTGDSDGDEPIGGMVGVIAEHRPHEFVSIEYTGIILNGEVDTSSEYAENVTGTHENYTFSESDGVTALTVDLDVDEDEEDMFAEMWPGALDKLKDLAEAAVPSRG
jgi:uncharacterized protein YndB with AHSA1/START domain